MDPSQLPEADGQQFERAAQIMVESRRGRSPEAVLDDYEQVSATGLERLAGMAALEMPVPLGDAGTYPAALLPAAFAFDHYTHIRADLFSPRGPLRGEPPPSDELRTGSVLDWIEAALPQQNAEAVAAATLAIEVTGPGGRSITFGSGPVKATVTSDAPAFVRWVTRRADWADLDMQVAGDDKVLAVARMLKVF